MVNIAIIDGDVKCRNRIGKVVKQYCDNKKELVNVVLYESPMDLLLDLDQGKYYNIYLLDIEMPVYSGIEVAREIWKYYLEPVIVYITDYIEYSIEAYEVNAFRYIQKGSLEVKLPEVLEAIIPKLHNEQQKCYIITHYLDMEILYHKEIYYLKKENKYVVIYHKRGESRVRKTLQEVLNELNTDEFLEIGKGTAVNIRHVMAIERQEIVLRNGIRIPASRRRMETIKERIWKYWTKEN